MPVMNPPLTFASFRPYCTQKSWMTVNSEFAFATHRAPSGCVTQKFTSSATVAMVERVDRTGVAQLRGKSAKQRAQELIAIAHPSFRAELTEAAKKMHIL